MQHWCFAVNTGISESMLLPTTCRTVKIGDKDVGYVRSQQSKDIINWATACEILLTWVANKCMFLSVSFRNSWGVFGFIIESTLVSAPLQNSLIVPSGHRAMTDIRPLSLVKSMMLRIWNVAGTPRMLMDTPSWDLCVNSKPNFLPPSTRATSSGEGPCSDEIVDVFFRGFTTIFLISMCSECLIYHSLDKYGTL